jgi:hypothetical protein
MLLPIINQDSGFAWIFFAHAKKAWQPLFAGMLRRNLKWLNQNLAYH